MKGKKLTAAECREIAERKMGEAVGDRRYGKELRATAQAWLILAERIAQTEAVEVLKAKGK
jgi:ABC-type phosphonate transport system ATPase subunit